MTRAGVPATTDLTESQRARLEALVEANELLKRYREPVPIDELERVAIFILDGAEPARWADNIRPDPFLVLDDAGD